MRLVEVHFPERLEDVEAFLVLDGFGRIAIAEAIGTAPDEDILVARLAVGEGRPSGVESVLAGPGPVFAHQFSRVLVEGDPTGREGAWNIGV